MTRHRELESVDAEILEIEIQKTPTNQYVVWTGEDYPGQKNSLRNRSLRTISEVCEPIPVRELLRRSATIDEDLGFDPHSVRIGLRLHQGAQPCAYYFLEKTVDGSFVAKLDIPTPSRPYQVGGFRRGETVNLARVAGAKLGKKEARHSGDGAGETWDTEEIQAAVDAYLEMLDAQNRGRPIVKAEVRRRAIAGPLSRRNETAFEFRMRNISTVYSSTYSAKWLTGYLPADRVGPRQTKSIKVALERRLGAATSWLPVYEFDEIQSLSKKAANWLSSMSIRTVPKGAQKPAKRQATRTVYARCPDVVAFVLARAHGVCEGCGSNAPFASESGPFLEVHHIVQLAAGGPDDVENAVAVCPNCHRRAHLSLDRLEFSRQLKSVVNPARRV